MSDRLRVGIDARVLAESAPKGVARYLSALLRAAAEIAPEHDYRLYLRAHSLAETSFATPPFSQHVLTGPPGLQSHLAWQQLQLPWRVCRDKVDVLVSPYYSGTWWSPVPQVIGVCDVSFSLFPHEFPSWLSFKPKLFARPTYRCATRVFTISEFSRNEIIRVFGLSLEKVVVVPVGSEALNRRCERLTAATILASTNAPFFLFVGSLLPRRQIAAVLQALAQLPPHLHLLVTGENDPQRLAQLRAQAEQWHVAGRVHCLGHVTDDALEQLYAKAVALVYPSIYEGFGLPLLEAMRAGLPVVAWDIPVFREVAGEAAVLLPVGDVSGLAKVMTRMTADDEFRWRLSDAGRRRAATFSWRHAARIFLAMLQAVANTGDLVSQRVSR